MEEIDNIIIDSLKQLHCTFEDNVTSLKQFDPDMIVSAIGACLEAINPGISHPRKLPPNMSLRLKTATNLAEQVVQLGFRGDMGYQTILYCNEVEVRRVLMFLIERLPRETSKVTIAEDTGYVPKLVKEIEERMKMYLEKPWIPAQVLPYGARPCENYYLHHSFGNSIPLHSVNLHIPNTKEENEDFKQYWVRHLSDVTKQCPQKLLIPSLLFKDVKFDRSQIDLKQFVDNTEVPQALPSISEEKPLQNNTINVEELTSIKADTKELSQTEKLQLKSEELYQNMISLQAQLKTAETKLKVLNTQENKEQEELNETLSKVKIKSKTLTVLSKEENLSKLKNLVENGNGRLVQLANQWYEMQTPLLEQYRNLQSNVSNHEIKMQQEQAKLKNLVETRRQLQADLTEKEKLEKYLIKKYEKLSNTANRSAYTRRILEIIGNIRKQNNDIAKVLKDANEVQKDINNLNGQVERSFTLSDELIFRDAKHNEMARKAYKLLVALHNECGEVIKGVTDLGLAERESRNLQEQVDAESAKDMASKLKLVNADLEQIRNETEQMLKNL